VNASLLELAVVPSLATKLARQHLKELDIADPAALQLETQGLAIKFDEATGAISSLVQKEANVEWAGGDKRLGEFVYRTYTQAHDIDRYVAQFTPDYAGVYPDHANKSSDFAGACWNKPGMDESIKADPAMAHLPLESISRAWNVSLTKAWKDEAKGTMLLQLSLPADAIKLFGGMAEVLLDVTLPKGSASVVELTLIWKGKTPAR
jgi:hypothetical protein